MVPLPMSAFSVVASAVAMGNGYWLLKSKPMQAAMGKLVELEKSLGRKLHLQELEEYVEGKLHLDHLLHGKPSATEMLQNPHEIPKGTLQGVALIVLMLVQLVLIWWLCTRKTTGTPPNKMCKLQVYVEKAVKLPNTDAAAGGDPKDLTDARAFVTLGKGTTIHTETVENNLNPVWPKKLMEFPIDPADKNPPKEIVIEVRDVKSSLQEAFGMHGELCGSITYDITNAKAHPAKEEKKALPLKGGKSDGKSSLVTFHVMYCRPNDKPLAGFTPKTPGCMG